MPCSHPYLQLIQTYTLPRQVWRSQILLLTRHTKISPKVLGAYQSSPSNPPTPSYRRLPPGARAKHTPRGCRLHFWDRPADRNWTRGVTSSSNCRYHMATPASTSSGQAPVMAGMASSSTSETSCWQCCYCRRKCSTGAGRGISNPGVITIPAIARPVLT